jgi:hypothetical protein
LVIGFIEVEEEEDYNKEIDISEYSCKGNLYTQFQKYQCSYKGLDLLSAVT